MYVDVRRDLVFFDRSDGGLNVSSLTRYDPLTGRSRPVEGAQPDDVVCDVSRGDGRVALRSAEWVTVRGASRSRITFLTEGAPPRTTDRILSHWSVFDPSGRYALTGILNGKGRPVVMDASTCGIVATMARQVDARFGAVDPVDGRLWVPDARAKNALLSVDCATGDMVRVEVPVGAGVQRVQFTQDGSSLLVVSQAGALSRHARDGSVIWTVDVSGIGRIGAGDVFPNQAGSHLLLSLPESRNSEWGEDIVVGHGDGRIEASIPRRRGPPARLAAAWFGDRVLTHAGEVVDFFSGTVTGKLTLDHAQDIVSPARR